MRGSCIVCGFFVASKYFAVTRVDKPHDRGGSVLRIVRAIVAAKLARLMHRFELASADLKRS